MASLSISFARHGTVFRGLCFPDVVVSILDDPTQQPHCSCSPVVASAAAAGACTGPRDHFPLCTSSLLYSLYIPFIFNHEADARRYEWRRLINELLKYHTKYTIKQKNIEKLRNIFYVLAITETWLKRHNFRFRYFSLAFSLFYLNHNLQCNYIICIT